jgi:hypothetical protein
MGSTHQASGPHRIEGHDKVTGAAKYAEDLQASDIGEPLDVAAVVTSSQGSSRVLAIDAEAARDVRGVRAIIYSAIPWRLTKEDIGGMKPMPVETLAKRAIAGMEKDVLKIRPGPANALKLGSRAKSQFSRSEGSMARCWRRMTAESLTDVAAVVMFRASTRL